MSDLKPCPFCGSSNTTLDYYEISCPQELGTIVVCNDCGASAKSIVDWNTRPIEDALNARIAELEKRTAGLHYANAVCMEMKHELARRDEIIARLKAELAELNDKAVFIQFENEDELPADISNDVYSTMFNCSHVDGVRLFPYIEENGQKYFLVMLREDE